MFSASKTWAKEALERPLPLFFRRHNEMQGRPHLDRVSGWKAGFCARAERSDAEMQTRFVTKKSAMSEKKLH